MEAGGILKFIVFLAILNFHLEAGAQLYKAENTYAEVRGDAPVGDYVGVSNELEGTLNIQTGEVYFRLPLRSLDTGNDKRDGHMYQTLNTDSHPYAEFTGDIISHFHLNNPEPQDVEVKGLFSIHGQQKEMVVTARLDPEEQNLRFDSSFDIHITQYGMKRPSIGFFKVDDKHTIKVSGILKEERSSVRN